MSSCSTVVIYHKIAALKSPRTLAKSETAGYINIQPGYVISGIDAVSQIISFQCFFDGF